MFVYLKLEICLLSFAHKSQALTDSNSCCIVKEPSGAGKPFINT